METVEVANKELKVESRLRNIKTYWEKEQLGFMRHRDTEVREQARRGMATKSRSLSLDLECIANFAFSRE